MGRDPEHEVDAPHLARVPWAIGPPHGFAPFSPAPMRLAARRGTVVSSSLSENACPNITMPRTPPGKGNGRFVFPDQLQNLRPAPDTFHLGREVFQQPVLHLISCPAVRCGPCAVSNRRAARIALGRVGAVRQRRFPSFPPLHTMHASFPAHVVHHSQKNRWTGKRFVNGVLYSSQQAG